MNLPSQATLLSSTVLLSLACTTVQAQTALLPRQIPGTKANYVVSVNEIDYAGAGNEKATAHISSRIPIRLEVVNVGGPKLQVIEGPLVIHGKPVGRTRTKQLAVDRGGAFRGFAPSYFSVPFPIVGAKPGQTWKAGLYGPAPVPGGLTGDYKFVGIQGGFAKIAVKIDVNGACHVVGAGELFVRVTDGYVDHGKVTFNLSYVRPDPKDRTKFSVNSHNVVIDTIDQR